MTDFASAEYERMMMELQNVIEELFLHGERLAEYPVKFSLLRDPPATHKDLEDSASRSLYIRVDWPNPQGGNMECSFQVPSPQRGAFISRGLSPAEGWWGRYDDGFQLHYGAFRYLTDVLGGEVGEYLEDARSRGNI